MFSFLSIMNDVIIPLSDGIQFIKGERNGKIPYSHSLLLGDHLIDTGVSRRNLRKVRKEFQVKTIIFSHWHEDHVRDNEIFKNAKCFIHDLDKPIIESAKKYMELYGVINTPSEPLFKNYLYEILRIGDTKIEGPIQDNEIVEIGDDLRLKIIHTPGHSAGHCCFHEIGSKIAFLADIDLSAFGPWYGCSDCDLLDFERSIDKLKEIDIDIAITGHNGMVEGVKKVKERLDAYKSVITARDELILEYFSEKHPLQVNDLMKKKIIYHTYNDLFIDFLFVAEKTMIQKHFDKFLTQGIIKPLENGYVLS